MNHATMPLEQIEALLENESHAWWRFDNPGDDRSLMFGWRRCSHEGIGLPGCRICDPDEERVASRNEWLAGRGRP